MRDGASRAVSRRSRGLWVLACLAPVAFLLVVGAADAVAHVLPGHGAVVERGAEGPSPPDAALIRSARARLLAEVSQVPADVSACERWLEAHRLLGRVPSGSGVCEGEVVEAVGAYIGAVRRHVRESTIEGQGQTCQPEGSESEAPAARWVRAWGHGCSMINFPFEASRLGDVHRFPGASLQWMAQAHAVSERSTAPEVVEADLWLTGGAILEPWRTAQDRERLHARVRSEPADADALLWMADLEWQRTRSWERVSAWLEAAQLAQPWRWDVELRAWMLARRARHAQAIARWWEGRGTWSDAGHALSALLAADAAGDDAGVEGILRLEEQRLGEPPLRWWVKLGRQAEASLRHVDAMRWYRLVLDHQPDHGEALGAVAMGVAREGRLEPDEILQELNAADAIRPWDVRLGNLQRWYQHRSGAYTRVESEALPGLRLEVPREETALWLEVLPGLIQAMDVWLAERYGNGVLDGDGLTVAVMESATDFSVRLTGLPNAAPHAAAFARVVMLRSPREDPYNWQLALLHELSHLVTLGQSRGRMPRWLSEGLAERDVAAWNPRWERPWRHRLSLWLATGTTITLRDVDRELLRGSEREMLRAYDLAVAWVHFVEDVFGHDGWEQVQAASRWGEPDPIWIPEALDMGFQELKRAFHRWLVRQVGAEWGPIDLALTQSPADILALLSSTTVSPDALAAAAYHALEAGAEPMASALLGEAERLDGNAHLVRYVGAERARRLEDVDRAIRIVDELLEEGLKDYRLLALCARLHDHPQGDSGRVEACRSEALARYPVDASLWQRDRVWESSDAAGRAALRQWWIHAPHDPRPIAALWLFDPEAAEEAIRAVDPFRTFRFDRSGRTPPPGVLGR